MENFSSKKIAVFGSTGSIGRQTLNVCRRLKFRVAALTCNRNIDLFYEQIREFRPEQVAVADLRAAENLLALMKDKPLDYQPEILSGAEGVCELADQPYDCIVMAIIGFSALSPMLSAIKAKQTIAMANKEVIVGTGEFILDLAERYGAEIYPVDSEPSAIWQCLLGHDNLFERVLLTASGGPFRDLDEADFQNITVEQALAHPIWSMGKKITIDSATMMNKGLEMIEISRLFQLEADQIEVLVHPQGIVHSAVEFADGGVIAQLGLPDMELPIQFALTYPERKPMPDKERLDLTKLQNLSFFKPDLNKFPALGLAYEAVKVGGSMPAVLNAANEIAVQAFLEKRISFPEITALVEQAMQACLQNKILYADSIEDILAADSWARSFTSALIS